MVVLTTNYDYWQRIYGRSIYDAEEIQESQILIDLLGGKGIPLDVAINQLRDRSQKIFTA
jgi:hypothetical protein